MDKAAGAKPFVTVDATPLVAETLLQAEAIRVANMNQGQVAIQTSCVTYVILEVFCFSKLRNNTEARDFSEMRLHLMAGKCKFVHSFVQFMPSV